MIPFERMVWRLALLPVGASLLLAAGAAWSIYVQAVVPRSGGRFMALGAVAAQSGWLMPTLFAVWLIASGWAAWIYWQWSGGRASSCPRCSMALGRERVGRWGRYRPCLGCRKNVNVRR
jgi:hypothetical protein